MVLVSHTKEPIRCGELELTSTQFLTYAICNMCAPRTRGIMETSKFGKEEKPYPHTEASRLSPLQSNPPAIRPSFHGLHAIARN